MAYHGFKPAEQAVQIGDDVILSSHIDDGVIVNADINASAAIAMSKTALVGGTGLTLSTNTLNLDTITSVGTLTGLTSSGAVHIERGDTTATADAGADDLIVENTGASGISILSADNADATLYFGSASDPTGGYLQWDYDNGSVGKFVIGTQKTGAVLNFRVGAGTTWLDVDTSGNAAFASHVGLTNGYEFKWGTGATKITGSTNYMIFDTNSAERMRIDSSGNVGVGAVINDFTPTLGVTGAQPGLVLDDSATEAFLVAYCDGDASVVMYDHSDDFIIKQAESIGGSSAADVLKLDSSKNATFAGDVHILDSSISAPTVATGNKQLVIEGSGLSGMTILSTTEGGIAFGDAADSIVGSLWYNHTNDTMVMYVNNGSRVTVSDSSASFAGQVLAADGSVSAPAYSFSSDTDVGMYRSATNTLAFATNGTVGLTIQNDQNITAHGHLYPNTNGDEKLGFDGYRWHTVYGVNENFSSDQTLKKNISTSDLGMDFINSLNPVKFNWKKDDTKKHYGFLAQEIKETGLSDSVSGEEGSMGMSYNDFIAPIVKALQELSSKVEALENA